MNTRKRSRNNYWKAIVHPAVIESCREDGFKTETRAGNVFRCPLNGWIGRWVTFWNGFPRSRRRVAALGVSLGPPTLLGCTNSSRPQTSIRKTFPQVECVRHPFLRRPFPCLHLPSRSNLLACHSPLLLRLHLYLLRMRTAAKLVAIVPLAPSRRASVGVDAYSARGDGSVVITGPRPWLVLLCIKVSGQRNDNLTRKPALALKYIPPIKGIFLFGLENRKLVFFFKNNLDFRVIMLRFIRRIFTLKTSIKYVLRKAR